MREYETGFIVQPEISEEGAEAILQKLDETLEKNGAQRLFLEDQGKRKLAYEIRKFHKGHYYYYLSFLDEGQAVAPLERTLRLDESVLRFMTVQRDDDVADIEGRIASAKVEEEEQQKRAAERAAREVEEAKARAESEERAAAERAAEDERRAAEQERRAAEVAAAEAPAAEGSADAAAPDAAVPDAAEDAGATKEDAGATKEGETE